MRHTFSLKRDTLSADRTPEKSAQFPKTKNPRTFKPKVCKKAGKCFKPQTKADSRIQVGKCLRKGKKKGG